MSQDFGIDNEGQGFDFDDDDETDLDKLLDIAGRTSDADDDDDSVLFFNDDKKEEPQPPVYETSSRVQDDNESDDSSVEIEDDHDDVEEVVVETYPEPVDYTPEPDNSYQEVQRQEPEPVEASQAREREAEVQQPYVAPVSPPEPAVQEYSYNNYETSRPIRKVAIKSEAEEIRETRKIIKILDTYRNLQSDARNIVSQFLDNDDMDDESTLVVKVLRADPMFAKTMAALKDSASQDNRVERVFYILRLNTEVLHNLGKLVGTLTDEEEEIPGIGDSIEYSKNVEEAINGIDKKIIGYVSATQSVLAAAEDEE